ncbi:MAG: hypothetical protein KIT02_14585 [Devosia sp.]|uniref:hypothetical protein n=1 Tax=Devosia sp. TaxID=1871048 RepID=UPI0024C51358|nr:hypothetical protein [Devosia sp.]UYN99137.1 MAG: hypothetical protein KIT02_14585 [Devosia sp.]
MVHFFGVFGPERGPSRSAQDAPRKTSFFGGLPDAALWAVPLSRAEQDACYLNGKAPEPDARDRYDDCKPGGERWRARF